MASDVDLGQSPVVGIGRAELEALYVDEWPRLVRVAYLLTNSRHRAEEIAQDAFVRLQSTRSTVRNPGGYLHTSVVNACRDVHRHQGVVDRTPLDRPDAFVDQHDELFDALATLPWKQHAVLVLRFHVDLPENDIASVLGCRPSTVRSLTRRALGALRKELS